ncbi:hypothetical protein [Ornithinimicrobium murale]|uniref:hypothetical protein n=1 Tax=Ornithinimicrobium murale TaxID=1050153 RepID=UPI000E0DC0A2|nr:hypothetical protein [Ornithinimicrobium murale]
MSIDTTPTEELVLELLAARHRLGESIWTLDRNTTVTKSLESLSGKGLVWFKSGIVQDTYLARLTDAGRARQLDTEYTPPGRAQRPADGPTLTPSSKYAAEQESVSVDRRLDVADAPSVTATLAPRTDFAPADIALWVRLDLDGTGRWSAHLWGAGTDTGHGREFAQFDGPVRDGQIVTYNTPPEWVLAELADMLTEATAKAELIR